MAKQLTRLSTTFIVRILAGITVGLLAVYLLLVITLPEFDASTRSGVGALFNLNAEVSIPTWYSQSILLIAAGLAGLVSLRATAYKKHWIGLGLLLAYISMDEGAAIHELTATPMRQLMGVESGPLYYGWVVLFGGLVLLIGALYAKFLLALPARTRNLFVLAGMLFVSGGIGMEMIGAHFAAQTGELGLGYALAAGAEEFLEMIGVVMLIHGLLDYIKVHMSPITISLD